MRRSPQFIAWPRTTIWPVASSPASGSARLRGQPGDMGVTAGRDGESWATSLGARRTMQSNRGRDTGPELVLRSELHSRGLRFRVNYRPIPALRRTADVVFTRA